MINGALVHIGATPPSGRRGQWYTSPRLLVHTLTAANTLAESIIGLFKTEVIHHQGPWKTIDAVELATCVWVDWYNNRRLLEPIGDIPPAELEQAYYEHQESRAQAA